MLRNLDRFVFVSLVSAVVLSSCGLFVKQNDSGDGPVQSPQLIAAQDVMLLNLEDPGCSQSVPVNTAQVWLWNGSDTVAKSVTLSAVRGTDDGLASAGTIGAVWDYQVSKNCSYTSGAVSCKKGTVTKAESTVKICRSNGTYQRDSIESMTLTTQYMSDLTRTFYYKLPASVPGLLKALLVIQPQELMHLTDTATGRTGDLMKGDNAAFAASSTETDHGEFWVYPTSKKSFAKNPVHLWEAPFVMRHEFGHNVFNHHVGTAADKAGLDAIEFHQSLSSIMRGAPKYKDEDSMFLDSSSQAQKDLGGLNETFADLFAYYSGDAAPAQLKGLGDSLETTRDPSSAKTRGGTKKVWTNSEANIYTGVMKPTVDSSISSEPDFTDVHDVAAAFGYNMSALLDKAMQGKSSVDKANVLILWANALASHLNLKGKSATLDSMTAEFVKVVVANKSGSVSDACADFAKNMSALSLSIAACN